MIKEAIKYLQETLIKPDERHFTINDKGKIRNFFIDDEGVAREMSELSTAAKGDLQLSTLTSLVDYIKSGELANEQRPTGKFYLHVENEKNVRLQSALDYNGYREDLIYVQAIVPHFHYEQFHQAEELIIAMQSTFVKTGDRDLILKVIGNLKEENVRNTGDDGTSQAVTIQTGVANAEGVKGPNPVTLAPYRTFLEVTQPESDFVFRMKDGPRAAIFEADGGAWRNEAIFNVREYLEEQLSEEVESGLITIIA